MGTLATTLQARHHDRAGRGGDLDAQLAIGSGQELQHQLVNERNALGRAHTSTAEDIRPWLLLFFVALVAFLFFEYKQRASGPVVMRNPILVGALVPSVASVAFAGVSCYWVYRIGHSGAKAVWVEKIQREGGGDRGRVPGPDGPPPGSDANAKSHRSSARCRGEVSESADGGGELRDGPVARGECARG